MIDCTAIIGAYCVIDPEVEIGAKTRVMPFVEIRDGVRIGSDCYIDSRATFTGHAKVGDRVTVRNAAIIARGCEIEDDSFICPQVMFNNLDHTGESIGGAKVGKRVFIGTNATIGAGITICDDAVIGAKALVTKDITKPGIYIGIPARRRP